MDGDFVTRWLLPPAVTYLVPSGYGMTALLVFMFLAGVIYKLLTDATAAALLGIVKGVWRLIVGQKQQQQSQPNICWQCRQRLHQD